MLPVLLDLPPASVLNPNVPDLPEGRLRGLRQGGLAPFGQVQMALAETGSGYVRTVVEESETRHVPGTDLSRLAEGYAAVTPLRSVSVATNITLPF